MKKISVILLLLSLTSIMLAEKVTTFPNLMRPFFIRVDDSQMYVTDGPTVSIYSLSDYKLLKQFGREGEGPGEFKIPARSGGGVVLILQPDSIVVYSMAKLSYFTKEGKYIDEMPTGKGNLRLIPLGENFIGEGTMADEDDFITYNVRSIYSYKFERGKELYRRKKFIQKIGDLSPFHVISPITRVYNNMIFINTDKDEILVFDETGNKRLTIKTVSKKLAVNDSYKKEFRDTFTYNIQAKRIYETIKGRLKFPKYFPTIRWFSVADDSIYILTYKKEGGKSEFLIYNIKGNFLKKVMLPFADRDGILWSPCTIKDRKLYQLIENEKTSDWELHITSIE